MTTPDALSPIVEQKLRQIFPDETEREIARKLLATYGTESWQREHNRVRLAILKNCNGKMDSLKGGLSG